MLQDLFVLGRVDASVKSRDSLCPSWSLAMSSLETLPNEGILSVPQE